MRGPRRPNVQKSERFQTKVQSKLSRGRSRLSMDGLAISLVISAASGSEQGVGTSGGSISAVSGFRRSLSTGNPTGFPLVSPLFPPPRGEQECAGELAIFCLHGSEAKQRARQTRRLAAARRTRQIARDDGTLLQRAFP